MVFRWRARCTKTAVLIDLFRVAQYLTEQYKFKYLSLLELVRFEEKVRSQEATEIRKAI